MKLILVVIQCFIYTFLSANTFEWKSDSIAKSVDNPLDDIVKIIQSDISKSIVPRKPIDLSTAVPKKIQKPTIPVEIQRPILPKSIKLVRGEFEKTVIFDLRVQKASNDRDKILKQIQEKYRKEVEFRNKNIEKLSNNYNQAVERRNDIIAKLQQIQLEDIKKIKSDFKDKQFLAYSKISNFAKVALDKVYGKPKLIYNSYDPDKEIMYLSVLSSDGKNFKKDIEIDIAPKYAEALKPKISNISPKVIFDIKADIKGNVDFEIKRISLEYKDKNYIAHDVTSHYTFKPVYITIANKNISFEILNKKLNLVIQKNKEFKLQNPNLNDNYKLGSIAYTQDGAIVGNNILVNKIKTLHATKKDKHRWLFIVSIENYDETDKVVYAKRSALAIKEAMQVRFGIDNRHTYNLLDSKATSGAIKDKLRSLVKNVGVDDTIYFYYSGHGIPGKDGDAYILPKDKIVDFIEKDPFFKLGNIYHLLSQSKAKHSFAFIDACFSGRTDDVLVFKGVAPGLIQTKKVLYDKSKMTILTAGLDKEFSNAYKKRKYRLFSYYLAKALIQDIKNVSMLYKNINLNVLEQSKKMGDRYEQTPQIYGKQDIRLY